ncbi:MAG: RCC1 domain-containing protein [Acidimicrobiales bacterium]
MIMALMAYGAPGVAAAGPSTTLSTASTALVSDNLGYCGVAAGGAVKCWGENDGVLNGLRLNGLLGDGHNESSSSVPVTAAHLSDAVTLASDLAGYCALLATGRVRCWGDNSTAWRGALGDGNHVSYSDVPVPVLDLRKVTAVVSAVEGYCALLMGGGVKCWGSNSFGELGHGSTASSDVPLRVTGLSGATALVAGVYNYCALLAGGTIKCWGNDNFGFLGDGNGAGLNSSSDVPMPVVGLSGATALVAGTASFCALVSGGMVKCWGYNGSNRLGDGLQGTGNSSNTPRNVINVSNATALASDSDGFCAVISGGTVTCWGDGAASPLPVAGLTGAVSLVGGNDSYCAIVTSGAVECWGMNDVGELGDGRAGAASAVPVGVTGVVGATGLVAGQSNFCALLTAGGVQCWGDNTDGYLGDGSTASYSDVPVSVVGFRS